MMARTFRFAPLIAISACVDVEPALDVRLGALTGPSISSAVRCYDGDEGCSVVPGYDRVEVGVCYGGVTTDDPRKTVAPGLTLRLDGEEWTGVTVGTWYPRPRAVDGENSALEPCFIQSIQLPAIDVLRELTATVTAGRLTMDSGALVGTPAEVEVVLGFSATGGAPLAGGPADVTVSTTPPLSGYVASVVPVVDEVAATTSRNVTLDALGEGTARFALPTAAGGTWTARATVLTRVDEASPEVVQVPGPAVAVLKDPASLPITIADVGLPSPQRALFDRPACRALRLGAVPPSLGAGIVSLAVSEGKVDGVVNLAAPVMNGVAQGLWQWSPALTVTNLVPTVTTTHGSQVTVTAVSLAPVYADPTYPAELYGPPEIAVGVEGSSEGIVTGAVLPPVDAMGLGPGLAIDLVVEAVPAAGALGCAPVLSEDDLRCDRGRHLGPSPGGCRATPAVLTVGADGLVSIALESGLCFAGELQIAVWGQAYSAPPVACLGDVSPGTIGELERIVVAYVAE